MAERRGTVQRRTKETHVDVSIGLDGTGVCSSESGIPFLDHMMDVRLSLLGLVLPQTLSDVHPPAFDAADSTIMRVVMWPAATGVTRPV